MFSGKTVRKDPIEEEEKEASERVKRYCQQVKTKLVNVNRWL